MENYIMLDGKKIAISEETARNMEKEFCKPTYSIGEKILIKNGKYIIATVPYINFEVGIQCALVCLDTGRLWCGAFNVSERGKIPESILNKHIGTGWQKIK